MGVDIQVGLYSTAPYLEFLPQPKIVKEHPLWEGGDQDGQKIWKKRDGKVRARYVDAFPISDFTVARLYILTMSGRL